MLDDLNLPAAVGGLVLRRADAADLDPLMALLSDDSIGRGRGDAGDAADGDRYAVALHAILSDARNELVVGVDGSGTVVATFQLTTMPGLARRGATRLQVEAVRVARTQRGRGVGSALMRWVLEVAAPAVGADLVQLTSDARREDAHRFYERMGMTASHVGFTYAVPRGDPG